MELGDFLKRELSNAGPWNCSTLAADWCVARGHPDFAAAWRHITDPGHCEAVQSDAGNLVVLWDHGIRDALPAVTRLESGDIAVLAALGLESGAIWTGQRWALRAARGLHFIAPDAVAVVKAWRP